jgi:hypothetical protein
LWRQISRPRCASIRDENEYGGVRIKGNATADNARVRILTDFGDATEPGLRCPSLGESVMSFTFDR